MLERSLYVVQFSELRNRTGHVVNLEVINIDYFVDWRDSLIVLWVFVLVLLCFFHCRRVYWS